MMCVLKASRSLATSTEGEKRSERIWDGEIPPSLTTYTASRWHRHNVASEDQLGLSAANC